MIMDCKVRTEIPDLCAGLPNEFNQFLVYCRSLKFDDHPDYSYLRKLIRDIMVREVIGSLNLEIRV